MSEATNSSGNGAADLVLALVRKACDGLFSLATSVDEIHSLKRLTILMELQKSWEGGIDVPSNEWQQHSLEQPEKHAFAVGNEAEPTIRDIIICHDCGRSELSTNGKFHCYHCGRSFQKSFTLMRHLLQHNNKNNDGSMFANGSNNDQSETNVKVEDDVENGCEDDEEEEEDDDDYEEENVSEQCSGHQENQKNRVSTRSQKNTIVNFQRSDSDLPNGLKKENNHSNDEDITSDGDATFDSRRKDGEKSDLTRKSQLSLSRYSFFPKLECPACGQHFRRTNSLKNHMANHTSRGPFFSHTHRNLSSNHASRYKRPRSQSDGDDRPALCCDCGKQFVNMKRLKIHSLTHSAPGGYSCDKCPLKFSVAASLKRHLQRHTGVRPHVCSKCGKSFVRSDELTAHERLHSNRNMFPCPICGKGFTRSIDMTRHQSCHETTKPFQCSQCDKSFVRHDFLKKHESTHLTRACPFCKDVFENRRNITLHIKREHPDKSVEDLFNITQSKLVDNSAPHALAQSMVSILEPNNLYEVPRNSLQIDLSPIVDDASVSAALANAHELTGQTVEREEEFS